MSTNSSPRPRAERLLAVINDDFYMNNLRNDLGSRFTNYFSQMEFERAKWGFRFVALAIARQLLIRQQGIRDDCDRLRETLFDQFREGLQSAVDPRVAPVGDYVLVKPELDAVRSSGEVSMNPFRSIAKQKIPLATLAEIIAKPRLAGLLDSYNQGIALAQDNISESLSPYCGLNLLAAGFVICFTGPDFIPLMHNQDTEAVQKVRLILNTLEAVCDDLSQITGDE